MKKLMMTSAIAAGLLASGAALADGHGAHNDFYSQVKVGITDTGMSDDAIAMSVIGGMDSGIHDSLSFEVDATFSVADSEESGTVSGYEYDAEGSFYTLGAYAVASYKDLGSFEPYARLGVAYTYVELDTTVTALGQTMTDTHDDSEFDVGASVGIKYNFTDQLGVLADFTTVSDLDTMSLGVQYAF